MPNRLLIEGHTDAAQYSQSNGYSNWELSADRANSARRMMEAAGIRRDQTTCIRGLADRQLRNPANALDPGNRRVSVVVQYQDAEPAGAAAAPLTGPNGSASERAAKPAPSRHS